MTGFKRQGWLWVCTLGGLLSLLFIGLVLSLWAGDYLISPFHIDDHRVALGVWRWTLYGVLWWVWPKLRERRPERSATAEPLSRRPLIVLVLLYEGLIVQNPMAAVWAGAG